MDIDISFRSNDNNIINSHTLSAKEARLFELKLSELAETADFCVKVCKDLEALGMSSYEMLTAMWEMDFGIFDQYVLNSVSEENKNKYLSFLNLSSVIERAAFCEIFLDKIKRTDIILNESSFFEIKQKSETFTYVKNSLSDEAYDVFTQNFKDPRLRYSKNLKEAVNAVIDGEVSYCLLPLEERGGNRLSSVSELIFSNTLKIVSITPVFGPDGTADMKYSLLCQDLTVPIFNSSDDRYFELCIDKDGSLPLFELLDISNYFGIKPYSINTVNFNTDDGLQTQYSIVLWGTGVDFTKILTYLTLFSNTFTPIGIYINID